VHPPGGIVGGDVL
jgi:urease accessory protein